MLGCPYTELTTTTNQIICTRVQYLTHFSQTCANEGLHPAQGLRLLKRARDADEKPCDRRYLSDVEQFILQAKNQLQPKPTTVMTATQRQPEHVLLQMQLPSHKFSTNGTATNIIDVHPDLHFVRTQRRFNKRRYARVRAVSRPSFWSGMMLSTVATGAFWGSTIQNTDWLTVAPITPDPSALILIGYILISLKLANLMSRAGTPYHRELNQARRGWLAKTAL